MGKRTKLRAQRRENKPGKVTWKITLATKNVLDFAGDSIIADVLLRKGDKVWEGWATYADDTLDGFSFSFRVSQGEFKMHLEAKSQVRTAMGEHLELVLRKAGFAPQPRTSAKRTGDYVKDYKVTAWAEPEQQREAS